MIQTKTSYHYRTLNLEEITSKTRLLTPHVVSGFLTEQGEEKLLQLQQPIQKA